MAEVGVLNLTIHDNSSDAAGGLNSLADALSRVKTAVGKGLGLSVVATQVTNLSKVINTATGTSTTVKQLTSLFNSIANFSKIKKINIDTESLQNLKDVVNGFNIGNTGSQLKAMQEALSKDWGGNASGAIDKVVASCKEIAGSGAAEGLAKMSKALSAYTKAYEGLPKSSKKLEDIVRNIRDSESQNALRGIEEARKTFESKEGHGRLFPDLQRHAGGRGGKKGQPVEGQMQMDLESLGLQASAVQAVQEATQEMAAGLEHSKGELAGVTRAAEEYTESCRNAAKATQELNAAMAETNGVSADVMKARKAELEAEDRARLERMYPQYRELFMTGDELWTTNVPKMYGLSAEIIKENATYAEALQAAASGIGSAVQPIQEVGQAAVEAKARVDALLESLNHPASFDGKYRDIVDFITGVSRPKLDAKDSGQFIDTEFNKIEQEAQAATKAMAAAEAQAKALKDSIDAVVESFGQTLNGGFTNGIQDFIDRSTGVIRENARPAEDSVSALSVPGLNGQRSLLGPFEYASDELTHYTQLLEMAKSEMNSWAEINDKAMNSVKYQGSNPENERMLRVSEEGFYRAAEAVQRYTEYIIQLKEHISNFLSGSGTGETLADQINERLGIGRVPKNAEASANVFSPLADRINEQLGIGRTPKSAMESANVFRNMPSWNQNINPNINTDGATESVNRLSDAVNTGRAAMISYGEAAMHAKNYLMQLMFGTTNLSGSMKKMFPTITGMGKRLGSLMKYRMLRSLIRSVTSGITEGVKNVYQYSNAVGTALAPAMDSAAQSFELFKNSIGAAAAPLITAFIPVINQVIGVVIQAINVINQLFALFNGQSTWTRAIASSNKAFDSTKKAAGGAGGAIKDLLADWDELNIIQSEGGGGGGGASDSGLGFENMFEEVGEFDERIRDAVKFINDHLGGIPGILKDAAAILLGWKFSKAFSGIVGKLGKLLIGGTLIKIGFEFSYGAGFDAGVKGGFDWDDILRSIIGAAAAGLGGYLIAGPTGLAIGIICSVGMTLVGYIQGQNDAADAAKWGDLEYTREQIDKMIKREFTFDVDAEIDVEKSHIANIKAAKKNVKDTITAFSNSLGEAKKIVAEVDTEDAKSKIDAIKQAATDAQEAILAVQALIDANEEGLTYKLTNFTFTDENGADITTDLLNSIKIADSTLREYFTGIGQELATLLLEGEKSGWKNGEMDAAIALMESQKRIYDRAEELKARMKYETESSAAATNIENQYKEGLISRDTAKEMIEREMTRFKEYEDTVKEATRLEADVATELAALAESAAIEAGYDPVTNTGSEAAMKLHDAAEKYKQAAGAILADLQGAVDTKLKDTKEKMAKRWAETLRVVYGGDFDGIELQVPVTWEDVWKNPLGDPWDSINNYGIEEIAGILRENLISQFTSPFSDYSEYVQHYISDLGGNIFDLMSEEAKRSIAQKLSEHTDASNAFSIFKAMFGIDDETAKQYLEQPEYQDVWGNALNAVQDDVQNAIEEAPPVVAQPAIIIDPVTADVPEYEIDVDMDNGVNGTIQASGMDMSEFVDSTEKAVDEVNSALDGIEDKKIRVEIDGADQLSSDALTYIRMIENAVNSGKGMDEIKEAQKQALDMFGVGTFLEVQKYITQLVDAYNELNGEANKISPNGRVINPAMLRASAMNPGMVSDTNYDNYLARLGAQNGQMTDNTEQQVASGVAQGNQAGNATRDSLLQQLISVCTRIANKDFTVNVSPSSGMGRTVKESSNMLSTILGW